MKAVDTDTFFKFRLIEEGQTLPANIALVQAGDLNQALAAMFKMAAEMPHVNFIVWNPPISVLEETEQQRLAEYRLHLPFSLRGRVYAHAATDESWMSSTFCKLQNLDNQGDDSVSHRQVKELVVPRIRKVFQAAGEVVQQHKLIIRPSNYEVQANDTEPPYRRPFHARAFHVDAEREPFLRLLFPSLGAGTYVAGAADVAYKQARTGVLTGTVVNQDATIWMMHTRAFALMKSGGSMPGDPNPAVHCVPFSKAHYNSAVDRVLERYDFNFK